MEPFLTSNDQIALYLYTNIRISFLFFFSILLSAEICNLSFSPFIYIYNKYNFKKDH